MIARWGELLRHAVIFFDIGFARWDELQQVAGYRCEIFVGARPSGRFCTYRLVMPSTISLSPTTNNIA